MSTLGCTQVSAFPGSKKIQSCQSVWQQETREEWGGRGGSKANLESGCIAMTVVPFPWCASGSGDLPQLAALCTWRTSRTSRGNWVLTHPDSAAQRPLGAGAWFLLGAALCACFLWWFILCTFVIINCQQEYTSSSGSWKSFQRVTPVCGVRSCWPSRHQGNGSYGILKSRSVLSVEQNFFLSGTH